MDLSNANFNEIYDENPVSVIEDEDIILLQAFGTGKTSGIKGLDTILSSGNLNDFKWVSTGTYAINQPVLFNGQWYISLVAGNIGNIPTDGMFWQLENKIQATVVKPWSSGIFIDHYSLVRVGTSGYALKPSVTLPFNSSVPPELDLTNWELVFGDGGSSVVPSNILYVSPIGDDLSAVVGDITSPWLTIKEAILNVPAFASGYKIEVLPGDYNQNVDFLGSVDGTNKEINIHMHEGVNIVNNDPLSEYTFRISGYTKAIVTGSARITAQTSNSTTHTCVSTGNADYFQVDTIETDSRIGIVTGNLSVGYTKVNRVISTHTLEVLTVDIRGNGKFDANRIEVSGTTTGEAVRVLFIDSKPVVNIGMVISSTKGVSTTLPGSGIITIGKIESEDDGLSINGSGGVYSVSEIKTNTGDGLTGNGDDSIINIGKVVSQSGFGAIVNGMDRSIINIGHCESVNNVGLVDQITDVPKYYTGYIVKGGTIGFDTVAQFDPSPASSIYRIDRIIGQTNGMRISQSAPDRITFNVEMKGCKIESEGVGVNDSPILINWLSASAGQILKLKDCELIGNGATNSIRNLGGDNFDISGYNVHSDLPVDVTNITLSTITEIL